MSSKKVVEAIIAGQESRERGDEWDDLTEEDQDIVIQPLVDYVEYIQDDGIRAFVRSCLYKAPEEFWTFSSLLTGEDHPLDEIAEHGTILHVRRAFRAAREIAIAMQLARRQSDLLFAAILLHDVDKFVEEDGESKYNRFHAYTIDAFFQASILEDSQIEASDASLATSISAEDYLDLSRLIRVHQGFYSVVPETTPENNLEWAMHLSDLIATRVHYIVDETPLEWRWKED